MGQILIIITQGHRAPSYPIWYAKEPYQEHCFPLDSFMVRAKSWLIYDNASLNF